MNVQVAENNFLKKNLQKYKLCIADSDGAAAWSLKREVSQAELHMYTFSDSLVWTMQ